MCAHWLFCTKFNAQQLLFELFSDIIGNFDSVEPKIESTFLFQYNIIFLKHINFSSPLAPLSREIDMCAHWLFYTKFNSQELLFEQFFDIIFNFGVFSPKLLKFHISFICKLCYHIYMITFFCSFNSSPLASHLCPKSRFVPNRASPTGSTYWFLINYNLLEKKLIDYNR